MDWISVKDRLPEYYEQVLVFGYFCGDGDCRVAHREPSYVSNQFLLSETDDEIHPSFWMPLPELPN